MIHLFLAINLLPLFLVRAFASYARLGPSADRRRTVVHRGSDGRTVTQQMSKRTTKNKNQSKWNELCKTNPIYAFFKPKTAIMRKNKPKQTQFKAKTNPIQTQSNPISLSYFALRSSYFKPYGFLFSIRLLRRIWW